MLEKTSVKQARKIGGSLMLPLTGYIAKGKFYKIEISNKKIILTPIDI